MDRRQFLEQSAFSVSALWVAARAFPQGRSPNEKLNIGIIGVGNRGASNIEGVRSENIVALCDVDDRMLAAAAAQFPQAKTYHDFRRMLEQKDIDAVVISTPDHTHAVATLAALDSGRHVYCEKPLTHTVVEARRVMEMARKKRCVTQLGTQIHAGSNYRRVVELIQTGVIGEVTEIHVWVGRVWSADGPPAETPPVPEYLHWDLWLGPAAERPYSPAYFGMNWRCYWDFGGGTLADMACHHMDLSHWALNLKYPSVIEAEGPPVNPYCAPRWLIVRYTYQRGPNRAPVRLTWYTGEKRPPHFAEGILPPWGDGTLFVGTKGMLLADYNRYRLLPEKDFEGFQPPPPFLAESIGHYAEWIDACKRGGLPTCHFGYGGALTQTVLLGNVAYRSGQKIEWDGERGRITNTREANVFLHKTYRKGWR
ncbi:MAG: Gfo/Idh/MocA family oxidoreductase [Chloroherpetonaceae bacterium]|nr:Gfo/Idh/MocA family oxidoreductase [Chthonomonadaceae bacterium]MDW8207223.1 Gfo/Idh/MocA family oxidoreductase [Chloroherpetonaceae bacterium]